MEGVNKVGLVFNYDKRVRSIDSKKKYEFWMNKNLVIENKEIKCNNNPNWLQILDHSYILLIIINNKHINNKYCY